MRIVDAGTIIVGIPIIVTVQFALGYVQTETFRAQGEIIDGYRVDVTNSSSYVEVEEISVWKTEFECAV